MKTPSFKKNALLFIMVCCCRFAFSQETNISGRLKDYPDGKFYLIRPTFQFTQNNVYLGFTKIDLNEKGVFDVKLNLQQPEIMKGFFNDSAGNQLAEYNFYITPGDDLMLESFTGKSPVAFKVTGTGAKNNQLLAIYNNDSITNFNGDTLPARAVSYLQEQNKVHQKVFLAYVKKYQPAATFINAWKANLQYEVLKDYFTFSTGNAYSIRDAYQRNYAVWNNITLMLAKDAPVSNPKALIAANYNHFLNFYLLRTKEKLWRQFNSNRSEFLYEWYGKDTAAGAALYMEDQSNDLQQRIIEKEFTGKTKEYLYAVLISGALGESEIKNLIPIYQKFKRDFPASYFIQLFEPQIKNVIAKKELQLNPKMKFIDGLTLFKNWEDILAYYKGKTVLLDMWGTWCGPCRQDMDRHSAYIKAHFKDKPLTYVYIANNDSGREKLWKELIAYFNLEGDHFIADKQLSKDIMSKVKGQGYPTYVIIHKDGKFELYNRGYGIDREIFIAQVEAALNN